MDEARDGVSRRDFVAGLVGGTAAVALGGPAALAAEGRALVVRVASPKVWNDGRRDPEAVAAMFAAGLEAFTGEKSVRAAWSRFVKPGEKVGLKINLLGRPFLVTAREVTDAVSGSLIASGVPPADVIVWDRYKAHFARTPYEVGPGRHGERIEAGGSYDASKALHASGGVAPIDRLATERTHATISLPVLKDHGASGVTMALKNIAFGAFEHHPKAHDNGCDPYIAEAYAHYVKHNRVALIVLDATQACFDGGPRPSDRSKIWDENAIYLATDPVALDVVGRDVIMERRRKAGLRDTSRMCRHIETARRLGLGIADPARIEVRAIEV